MNTDFEKQIVLRAKRLIRVRNVRCLRSIWGSVAELLLAFLKAIKNQEFATRYQHI